MKVLSIFGGPRRKGNTATVLGWVEDELKDLGHQIERINLSQKNVHGCVGCLKCKDSMENPGCVQKDDGTMIIDSMLGSDVVLFTLRISETNQTIVITGHLSIHHRLA